MNRDPVLFRVDGTVRTGWERLTRCQTFAAALQRRRRPTYFLSQLEPASLGMNIKRGGNDWLDADSPVGTADDLEETLQEIRRLRPAAVIVDAPEATEEYLSELTATGALIVSLDNLANIRFPSQLVINPLLSPGREAYDFVPGTQILLGSRFALVRPEVRRTRAIRSQEPAQPYRALVALGDDDTSPKAVEIVRTLMGLSKLQKIDLAVRPQHPYLEKFQALVTSNPDRLELATEPAEWTARIARCHLAITAGSGWSLELACVGVPQLLIVQTESNWPTAQRLEDEGAAVCLGWHENVSSQTIRQTVQDLLNDNLERQALSRCGRKLIDGRGPDRLVTALEVMLHPSRLLDLSEAA